MYKRARFYREYNFSLSVNILKRAQGKYLSCLVLIASSLICQSKNLVCVYIPLAGGRKGVGAGREKEPPSFLSHFQRSPICQFFTQPMNLDTTEDRERHRRQIITANLVFINTLSSSSFTVHCTVISPMVTRQRLRSHLPVMWAAFGRG